MTHIVRLQSDPPAEWQPYDDTPPDAFTTDDKTEINHTYFTAEDGSVVTGVWECAPSKFDVDSYPVHEYMNILAGSVTVTDLDTGQADTFNAGDTFFIAKGSRLTWEITETVRKFYCITP